MSTYHVLLVSQLGGMQKKTCTWRLERNGCTVSQWWFCSYKNCGGHWQHFSFAATRHVFPFRPVHRTAFWSADEACWNCIFCTIWLYYISLHLGMVLLKLNECINCWRYCWTGACTAFGGDLNACIGCGSGSSDVDLFGSFCFADRNAQGMLIAQWPM